MIDKSVCGQRTIITCYIIISLCLSAVKGAPLKWGNTDINWTLADEQDPLWQEFVMWSNDKIKDEPILPHNRAYKLRNASSTDPDTDRRYQELKANFTGLLRELDKGMKNKDVSTSRGIVDKTLRLLNLQQVISEVETSVMSKMSCTACRAGVGLLQHYIRSGKSVDEIIKLSYQFCVSLKMQTPRVCEGITQLFGGEVVDVLSEVKIGPHEACSFIIGDACGDTYNPTHDWDVVFPPVPKPKLLNVSTPSEPGSNSFKVLHLSDTHFDPYYQEGSNADCNEPLCCRLTNGPALSEETKAGRWGDYRKCDTPKRTVDNMLQHIASTHPDIDYVLWTGDLPPHDVWNQTRQENLNIIRQTVGQLNKLLPGIPIFPALGNHEASPVNSFPPPFVRNEYAINWLYEELDKQWRQWLPSSVSKTVRKGAFYSVLVRPGFRIISLNMNYCNNKNWWLLVNSTDPAKELQWFIYELQSAEFNEEKVHIIGHIPPGHSDCLKVWSRNYYAIIERYESTITAQFFGHTHFDEFELFYDTNDLGRAISTLYIGPSVTPYYNLNPSYRIYYVDGDRERSTRAVLDHETWVMNLKEANLYDYPIWYKLYTARVAYQMNSLSHADWDLFTTKLADDDQLFEQYYKHYWKNSPMRPVCDLECKKRMLCDLRSGRSHDRKSFCQDIESRIDGTNQTGWKAWLYNGFSISTDTPPDFELINDYDSAPNIREQGITQNYDEDGTYNLTFTVNWFTDKESDSENTDAPTELTYTETPQELENTEYSGELINGDSSNVLGNNIFNELTNADTLEKTHANRNNESSSIELTNNNSTDKTPSSTILNESSALKFLENYFYWSTPTARSSATAFYLDRLRIDYTLLIALSAIFIRMN